MKAFLLIRSKPATERKLLVHLQETSWFETVEVVWGAYDIIAKTKEMSELELDNIMAKIKYSNVDWEITIKPLIIGWFY